MKRILLAALVLGGGVAAFGALPRETAPKFRVPEGFEVEEVLPPEQAQSVVALTFDAQGRLVLAKEFGNVVTLIPGPDGQYEQRIFTEEVHTSQGIFFDGPDLLVVGSGPQGVGLYRVVDQDGDARGDRVELIELATGTIGDHGPHAPLFGPDGYLYWVHGNFSNIYADPSPLSPVRGYKEAVLLERPDPRGFGNAYEGGPGGVFLRKPIPSRGAGRAPQAGAAGSADWELVAMGFRNQYDGAFNLLGELITYDSDMEWDRDLPWYRPTRSVHVVPGGDYGFREGTGKHPSYYFDDLPPLEDLGRGSPTGVTVLHTYNYPREYWDMVLLADWSRGRIIGTKLTKDGATYRAESMNFVYAEPLNVTDLEVGPDGNLYFALGGRSTRGGVYRVVYRGRNALPKPEVRTPIDRVLTMIQPRSAFSRELARKTKEEMGEGAWQQALTAEVRNTRAPWERRVRAMELLHVFGPGLDENVLVPLGRDPSWEVRAASTYYLGLKPSRTAQRELVARLKDADPFVQRRAAEALLRTGVNPTVRPPYSPVEDVLPLLASPDRFVRYAGRALLRATNPNLWKEAALELTGYPQAPEALMAYLETITSPDTWDVRRFVARELELLRENPSDRELLDLVRVIQRTILESNGVRGFEARSSRPGLMQERRATGIQGGVQAAPRAGGGGGGGRGQGQRPNPPAFVQIGQLLLERFPTADSLLNREIARVLVALDVEGATGKIAAELSRPGNGREQQFHYAWMLSFARTGWDETSIGQMTAWLERVYREGWRGGASFAPAVEMLAEGFLSSLPVERRTMVAQRLDQARPRVAAAMPGQGGGAGMRMEISDEEILESLVYNPDVLEGDPVRGVAAYHKAGCASCHTFGPIGTEFGPDLTTVNQRFTRLDLVRAVMYPSETISDQYEAEEITRTNGQKLIGIVTGEDGGSVRVMVAGGVVVTIPKSEIRTRARSRVSLMPEGLLRGLTGQEQRDLFALLEAGPSVIPDSLAAR